MYNFSKELRDFRTEVMGRIQGFEEKVSAETGLYGKLNKNRENVIESMNPYKNKYVNPSKKEIDLAYQMYKQAGVGSKYDKIGDIDLDNY